MAWKAFCWLSTAWRGLASSTVLHRFPCSFPHACDTSTRGNKPRVANNSVDSVHSIDAPVCDDARTSIYFNILRAFLLPILHPTLSSGHLFEYSLHLTMTFHTYVDLVNIVSSGLLGSAGFYVPTLLSVPLGQHSGQCYGTDPPRGDGKVRATCLRPRLPRGPEGQVSTNACDVICNCVFCGVLWLVLFLTAWGSEWASCLLDTNNDVSICSRRFLSSRDKSQSRTVFLY